MYNYSPSQYEDRQQVAEKSNSKKQWRHITPQAELNILQQQDSIRIVIIVDIIVCNVCQVYPIHFQCWNYLKVKLLSPNFTTGSSF